MSQPWISAKLKDCFKLKSGENLTAKNMIAGEYPVFGGNSQAGTHNDFNLSGDNVIVGRVGALCGNARHFTENIWLTDNAFKITQHKFNFDNRFLTYLLNFKNLRQLARQAAQPVISNSSLADLELSFPESIQTQKQIVAKLDQAFADIEKAKVNAEQNLKSSRELFDSYLEKIFSQKSEGLIERELLDICNFKHGFAFKSEFFVPVSDYVLLTPGNFYEEGGYRDRGSKQKYYQGDFPVEYLLSKGDLLIAMTEQAKGLLGSPILVPDSGQFLHNQRLGLVELSSDFDEKIHLPFMYHFFNTKYFRSKVQETATGLKVRHTSPKKMAVISLSFPCELDVQVLIAGKLDKAKKESLKLESIYTQKIKLLDELKQSILQKAFNGELA